MHEARSISPVTVRPPPKSSLTSALDGVRTPFQWSVRKCRTRSLRSRQHDRLDDCGGTVRRWEFVGGKSEKFWEVGLDGTAVTSRYGRIGTNGQATVKEFDSA